MRFLHLADLHLDTLFACRGSELASRLRRASRDAFVRAIDYALEHDVHAVLVAGDLFDRSLLAFETQALIQQQVERLASRSIPFFYATGNHDPAQQLPAISWPSNAVLFTSHRPKTVAVRNRANELVGTVTGAGHESATTAENLASHFPNQASPSPSTAPPDALHVPPVPHVALLHAQVEGARTSDQHERYAPCGTLDLSGKGYHYWALGHVHERQAVNEHPPAWYPGNLQGRTPREAGPRGGLLVTVAPDGPADVRFIPFATAIWETRRINDLAEIQNREQLLRRLTQEARSVSSTPQSTLLRLILEGDCPLHRELADPENLIHLEQEIAIAGFLDVELATQGLTRPLDLDLARARNDVLGESLRLLAAIHTNPSALERFAPAELAGCPDPTERSAYLRSLLDGADREIAHRLLVTDS